MSALNGLPPFNVDAERSVLSAIVLAGTVPGGVLEARLEAKHFWLESHATIYDAMTALQDRGVSVTALTVTEELDRQHQLERAGGRAGIAVLDAPVPHLASLGDHAGIIRDLAYQRDVRDLARRVYDRPGDRETIRALAALLTTLPGSHRRSVVPVGQFLEKPRAPLDPFVTANDGRSVLLAAGTALLIGGPSGIGKSLAGIDLCGLLASDGGGTWIGTDVTGRQRVLLVTLEGSDEDTADRLRALIPRDAHARLFLDDRWANGRSVPTPADVAATVREHGIDVVCIDTIPAWLQDRYDISRGIPEQANDELETIRRLADRDIAFVGIVHTRKLDRAAGSITDELEELAGTLAKKADSAVVIRRDGDGPRRKISFAKTRRGPEPVAVIASLPDPDSDEPPRLRVIAEAKPRLKEGTEAERIAEWIGEQQAPATVSVLTAALEISEDTLRRRRPELEGLGIRYGQVPGRTARAYGTPEQWRDVHGLIPEDAA